MNLQTKRIQGGRFSAEDKLEVSFDTDTQELGYCVHTVNVVSGIDVTHGGGGASGSYLHYKNVDNDGNQYGVIDYSTTLMEVKQVEKGTSVITIKANYLTLSDAQANREARIAYLEANPSEPGDGQIDNFVPPHAPSDIETGQLTLEWLDDTFV